MKYLFSNDESIIEKEEIRKFYQLFHLPDKSKFINLKKNWWRYLYFLFQLKNYFSYNNIRSLNFVPLYSYGRKHCFIHH
jgi:hypothetical protein